MAWVLESYKSAGIPREAPVIDRRTHGFERWLTGFLAVMSFTAWIAIVEVDRLLAGARTPEGAGGTASSLQGFEAGTHAQLWTDWLSLPGPLRQEVSWLLVVYAVLDVVFPALYIPLLWRFFGRRVVPCILLGALAAAEATEAVLLFISAAELRAGSAPPLAGLLPVAAVVKWAALGALVPVLFSIKDLRDRLWSSLRRAAKAVFFQRLSAAVILIIGVLALLPIAGVNDQMPDTQRAWAAGSGAAWQWVLTSVVVLVVAAGMAVMGRRRSELAWDLYAVDPPVAKLKAAVWPWWLGPAVLLAALAVVVVRGVAAGTIGLANPPRGQFWFFLALPVGLLVFSLVFPRCLPLPSSPTDRLLARDIWRCGDVLAMLFAAVSGMALVRSFTAPVALAVAQSRIDDGKRVCSVLSPAGDCSIFGWSVALLAFGWLTVGTAFWVGNRVVKRCWPVSGPEAGAPGPTAKWYQGLMDPRIKSRTPSRWAAGLGLGLAIGALVLLAFAPAGTTEIAGVTATAVAGVAAWAMVFGFLIAAVQHRRPLAVFERMGLRANPFLSIVAVILAVGSLNGGDVRVHAIRQLDPAPLERSTLQQRFDEWLAGSAACHLPGAGASGESGPGVRPMLLVASEGGGIRATEWTVQGLARLGSTGGAGSCGAKATLLSSGVSGGSVGLALATLYGGAASAVPGTVPAGTESPADAGQPQTAAEASTALADPQALAAAVSGAAVGDIIASGTGLMVPAGSNGTADWYDRAALMETRWEEAAPPLVQRFSAFTTGPAGALIMNSTASGLGCRLLVSQLKMPAKILAPADYSKGPAPEGAGPGCLDPQGFPLSIDLLAQQELGSQSCPLGLRWSTAAMLSARFPIIAPAGRVPALAAKGGCDPTRTYQAIDGGYSEGSALGTLSDLMPTIRAAVQQHNAQVEAAEAYSVLQRQGAAGGAPEPPTPPVNDYIVPVVLFLQNHPGTDRVEPPPAAAGELAVPLVGLNARALQISSTAWLQRLDGGLRSCPSPSSDSGCQAATNRMLAKLGGRAIVVVAPDSIPALDPPLGWSLSSMSRNQLDAAMEKEVANTDIGEHGPGFGALLKLLP
ncbi:hypothetical protein [Arthrobacter sp. 35W]|uniref:hypothetical protein n=1 Tax=Arthrobacter sp. 35W TaxID=1132441 RepID=UPI0004258339|nr:hypothetical protein [Arthrobacter sp. 35W]